MKNLAGVVDCDIDIERELVRCGIKVVRGERAKSEVPYSITGKLSDLTFIRAWSYWVVDGNVPLNIAKELYADPVGKTDVRVDGHCGCPPPNKKRAEQIGAESFITSYHIDSEIGLRLFAETLKRHGLK